MTHELDWLSFEEFVHSFSSTGARCKWKFTTLTVVKAKLNTRILELASYWMACSWISRHLGRFRVLRLWNLKGTQRDKRLSVKTWWDDNYICFYFCCCFNFILLFCTFNFDAIDVNHCVKHYHRFMAFSCNTFTAMRNNEIIMRNELIQWWNKCYN